MPEVRVNRTEFLQKLEIVKPGHSPAAILEQSNCVILKAGWAITYNGEVSCRTKSGLPKELEGAVRLGPLLAVISKMADDEVGVVTAEGELRINGKRRKAGVAMQAEIGLPLDQVEKPTGEWHPLPEDFSEALALVADCAGKDTNVWVSTCVHFHPKHLEAGDKYQVARYKLRLPIDKPTLVKALAVREMAPLSMTEVTQTTNWLHFRNGAGLYYSCLRYADDYPDLTPEFEPDPDAKKLILPKGIAEAAEAAGEFSKEDEDNNQLVVKLSAGRVLVKGIGASGWLAEINKVAYDDKPITFLIPPKVLSEVVTKYDEVKVSAEHLRVATGKFVYSTSLEVTNGEDKHAARDSEGGD